ncbi:stage III sporulation protein AF [Paenibacillus sp. CC-CFT747]|nr:stage III sporulation protein AF [Paenibacillus sp. CC-CFT747]
MSWLSGWLKELIVIIMLASFVDLLLPSRSMERYVKTVISLFILLVLLSPVFKLFQTGWDPDKLIPTVESSQKALAVGGRVTDGGMQELSAILEQADKLKETNAAQAKRLVETQLSGSIQAGIERSLNLRVAEVTSAAELNDANRMEIKSVQVWLKPGELKAGRKARKRAGP